MTTLATVKQHSRNGLLKQAHTGNSSSMLVTSLGEIQTLESISGGENSRKAGRVLPVLRKQIAVGGSL